jgi:hypothetical protein
VSAVCYAWTRRFGHRRDLLRLISDIDRRNAQIVTLCQQVSETALGRRPDKRRRRLIRREPNKSSSVSLEDDAGILSSIRLTLYKRTARASRENSPLLPTECGRLKGFSAIEEVVARLTERFSSDSPDFTALDNALNLDGPI